MKTIWKGCAALALGLLMAQCDNKQVTTPVANAPVQSVVTNGLKIAFSIRIMTERTASTNRE
jgi:hypothetical protein